MTNKFVFSPIKENKEIIERLKGSGYYPIQRRLEKNDWLRRVMNHYPLWMYCWPFFVAPRLEMPSPLVIIGPNRYICSGTEEIVPDGG